MEYYNEPSREMPALVKAVILAFVGLFIAIGLIGLVLPIIPGILFLALAAWLLPKVSGRFAFPPNGHSAWRRFKRYLHALGFLSFTQKVKFTALLMVRSIADGLDRLMTSLRRRRH